MSYTDTGISNELFQLLPTAKIFGKLNYTIINYIYKLRWVQYR